MTWIDRLDAHGRRLDARWDVAVDRAEPMITGVVMGIVEIGFPLLGVAALGYLLL